MREKGFALSDKISKKHALSFTEHLLQFMIHLSQRTFGTNTQLMGSNKIYKTLKIKTKTIWKICRVPKVSNRASTQFIKIRLD